MRGRHLLKAYHDVPVLGGLDDHRHAHRPGHPVSEAEHGADVMNAVRCNLGTLGVIHEITFRVPPDFHLTAVDEHLPLSLTEDPGQLRSFLSGNDYVEVFWLPLASGL